MNIKVLTKDFSDHEMEEDIKQRPDLWFYQLSNKSQNKVISKVLTLHLVEATVPFGIGSIDFQRNEEKEEDLYNDYILRRNTLKDSKHRKEQKYQLIEAKARDLLRKNDAELRRNFHYDRAEVVTHYIVVSSLGVVPKDTFKEVRRICKVRDRDSSQAATIMAKRISIAAIKRSQEIYSGTFSKDCKPNEVIDPRIEPKDRRDEIKEKQFDALQNEMPAQEELIVGDKFDQEQAKTKTSTKLEDD
jgi:hypothetical protein